MPGSFNFKVPRKDLLECKIGGIFDENDVKRFISAYKSNISKIDTSNATLFFDATDLKILAADMVPMMEGCFTMYKTDNFKKVQCRINGSAVFKMQLKRIARNVGLHCLEIVD